METERCLEQLEADKSLTKDILVKEYYLLSRRIENLTFEDLFNTLEFLHTCGFSDFEGLYFICGSEIKNCPFLSKKTKKKIVELLQERKGEKAIDWNTQLGKIIEELDEKMLLYYLREDSKRFAALVIKVENTMGNTKETK